MADLERIYTIPLRREFLKAPSYKRAKKSVNFVREFLMRHMKANEVKIGRHLNQKILERGRTNPPSKVQVKAIKENNIVKVELVDFAYEEVSLGKVEEKGLDLRSIKEITRKDIKTLKDQGYRTAEELSKADVKDLAHKLSVSEELAIKYIEGAKKALEERNQREKLLEEKKELLRETKVDEKLAEKLTKAPKEKRTQAGKEKGIIGSTGKK